jgi:hypothetical protein
MLEGVREGDSASGSDNETGGEDGGSGSHAYTHVKGERTHGREEEGEHSDGGGEGRQGQCKKMASLSPAERKRRRLESNRAAAKRAYYRRQSKTETIQQENSILRSRLHEERFKVTIFKNLLTRLGVNPDVALAAITGHAVPTANLTANAGQGRSSSMQQLNITGSASLGPRYSSTPSLRDVGTTNGLSVSAPQAGSARGLAPAGAAVGTAANSGASTSSGPPF